MEPLTHYTIGIIYRQQEPAPFDSQQPGRLSRLLTLIRQKVEAATRVATLNDRQPNIPLIECYGEQE